MCQTEATLTAEVAQNLRSQPKVHDENAEKVAIFMLLDRILTPW